MYKNVCPKKLIIIKDNIENFNIDKIQGKYKNINTNPFREKNNNNSKKKSLTRIKTNQKYIIKKDNFNNNSNTLKKLSKKPTQEYLLMNNIYEEYITKKINSNDNIFNFFNKKHFKNEKKDKLNKSSKKFNKINQNNNETKIIFNRVKNKKIYESDSKLKHPEKFINNYCKKKTFIENNKKLLNEKTIQSKSNFMNTANNSFIDKKLENKFSIKRINKDIKNKNNKNKNNPFNKNSNSDENIITKKVIKNTINNNKNKNKNNNYKDDYKIISDKKTIKENNIYNNNKPFNISANTKPTNISSFIISENNENNKKIIKNEISIKRDAFNENLAFLNLDRNFNNKLILLDSNSKSKENESKFLNYDLGKTNGLSQLPDSLILSFDNTYINSKNNIEKEKEKNKNNKIINEYECSGEEIYKAAKKILDSNKKLKKIYINKKIKENYYELNNIFDIDELKEGEDINRIINISINYKK